MAKLKAPLLSLGAAGKLGDALVFFGWKGLDVVREYVIPSNPNTTLQQTQRAYVTAAVADIHAAQAAAVGPFNDDDKIAYAKWGSLFKAAMTWFNQAVKNWLDQNRAGLSGTIWRGVIVTPAANQLTLDGWSDEIDGASITAGDVWYGTSPTALLNSVALTLVPATNTFNVIIPGLTTGVKYYMQCRPTAAAGWVGANSGIYYGYPT